MSYREIQKKKWTRVQKKKRSQILVKECSNELGVKTHVKPVRIEAFWHMDPLVTCPVRTGKTFEKGIQNLPQIGKANGFGVKGWARRVRF